MTTTCLIHLKCILLNTFHLTRWTHPWPDFKRLLSASVHCLKLDTKAQKQALPNSWYITHKWSLLNGCCWFFYLLRWGNEYRTNFKTYPWLSTSQAAWVYDKAAYPTGKKEIDFSWHHLPTQAWTHLLVNVWFKHIWSITSLCKKTIHIKGAACQQRAASGWTALKNYHEGSSTKEASARAETGPPSQCLPCATHLSTQGPDFIHTTSLCIQSCHL